MYAVLVALATLSWWLLVEAEQAVGRKRTMLWVAYAAVAVILAYTHYLGFLDSGVSGGLLRLSISCQ